MSAHEADQIQALLTRLMGEMRENVPLAAEIARSEREFFQANPNALQKDPSARFRFQEWFLIERESDVLGVVPATCAKMSGEERESLTDSLVGVFCVTGSSTGEYLIEDLQDQTIHDLIRIDGAELETGDIIIGRLFEGSLDTFIASSVMSCQRDATALGIAFQKDFASMELDRRLTQAEIEHLLFRGRGAGGAEPMPDDVPLERIEADLEACLVRGGAEGHSTTEISAALRQAPRPGPVTKPLLEKIAFDTEVDIEAVQRLLLQIWNYHQAHATAKTTQPDLEPVEPTPEADEIPRPEPEPLDEGPDLGRDVARRIQEGKENAENPSDVFADIERMVGVQPDPSFAPDSVDLSADHDTDGDEEPMDGDLRPLITEYLWETGRNGVDVTILEELVRTQCESSVPRLELELVTSDDLFRLLVHTYLSSAPGDRTATVGQTFAVLERFYSWVEKSQSYELNDVIATARAEFVDHVARLEAAGLALSAGSSTASADASLGEPARNVLRVISVANTWIEVDPDESDNLVRIETASGISDNLFEGDVLLGTLHISTARRGSFAGMVVALPAIATNLLG
jgi:hypothetical protein